MTESVLTRLLKPLPTPAAWLAKLGALASADYTAADVLAKLLTVDGTGSGLDADTVDGNHAATGTFTPTATLVTNLDSASTYVTPYVRIGSTVWFSGIATVNATALAQCQLDLSLPVASNLSATTQLAGSGGIIGSASVYIIGDATNDRARIFWTATTTAAINLSYSIFYQVI